MIVSEAEAATKWCPFAIASHTDPRAVYDEHFNFNCIGSKCMAWSWVDYEDEVKSIGVVLDPVTKEWRLGDATKLPKDLETGGWSATYSPQAWSYGVIHLKRPNPNRRGECQRTLKVGDQDA